MSTGITQLQTESLETRVQDFSSRFSPVLVKELRQGMRTNLFTIAFILLQTFMILCLVAGIADPGSRDADGFFWFFIIATLLIVQPLRGFGALSSEYQLNTMDLIQLTKLDGWRITLGKWTALNAQGLLFLTGVLPYLVIRYFLGNVDFVTDLVALGAIGLGSALATAITIGCSVFKNIILRGLLLAGMFFSTATISSILSFSTFGGRGGGPDFESILLFSLAAIYGVIFFLSFGASRIAPLSENLATRKRLIAIGFVLIAQIFHLMTGSSEEVIVVTMLILGFACIDALTEPLPIFSRILAPFREKPFGKVLALFFSPGWISGIAFFLLCSALLVGALLLAKIGSSAVNDSWEAEDVVMILSLCNVILFPLLIIHLFFVGQGYHVTFGIYLFIQAGLFVLTLMVIAIANALQSYEELICLCVPLPSVFIYSVNETSGADSPLHLSIVLGTFLICIGFPLIRQKSKVREFFATLNQSSHDVSESVAES